MQTIYDHAGATTSYFVALITLMFASFIENIGMIAQLLGFVLLIARLIVEVPAAIRVLKRKFRSDDG